MRLPRKLEALSLFLCAALFAIACGGTSRADSGVGGVIVETVARSTVTTAGAPASTTTRSALPPAAVVTTATQAPAQPSPTARPATTAVASPTTIATPPALSIVSLTSPVARKAKATLTVQTTAGADCSIAFAAPGATSTTLPAGLEAKKADSSGKASWTWTIDQKVKPGSGAIRVRCGSLSLSSPMIIS